MLGSYDSLKPQLFSLDEYVSRVRGELSKVDHLKLPDFLILSPPRAGSAWLAVMLNSQPGIYIPPEKGLRFFDVGWLFGGIENYVSRFARVDGALKGDASPSYVLLPTEIIRLIAAAKPQMKFIVCVRDMMSRAWSNFCHSFSVGEFGLRPGATLQDVTTEPFAIDYLTSDYSLLVGDYKEYLTRWFGCFPREQFFVFGMNELANDAGGVIDRACAFLNVPAKRWVEGIERVGVNGGLKTIHKTETIKSTLQVIFGSRQGEQDEFLRLTVNSGQRSSLLDQRSSVDVITLISRADGYKVFAFKGRFYACLSEEFQAMHAYLRGLTSIPTSHFVSRYLSDLMREIEGSKYGTGPKRGGNGEPGRREVSILNVMAYDYAASNKIRTSLIGPVRVGRHRDFDVFIFGGRVLGVNETLGAVDLSEAYVSSVEKGGSAENIVVGSTLPDVVRAIEQAVAFKSLGQDVLTSRKQGLLVVERLGSLETTMADRSERLVGLEARLESLAHAAQRLSALEGTTIERGERLADVEQALAERTTRIASLEQALEEKGERLRSVEERLAQGGLIRQSGRRIRSFFSKVRGAD